MIMKTTTHTRYSPPSKRTIFHPNLHKQKLDDWTIKRRFKRILFCFPLAFTLERNFFQNSKVNMLTMGFIPLFVFEKPYKNINKQPNTIRPQQFPLLAAKRTLVEFKEKIRI